MLAVASLFIFFIAVTPWSAFGWSEKAQEDIEEAAVQVLSDQNHPLAATLTKNLVTLKRVALVPEFDWQSRAESVAPSKLDKKPLRRVAYHEEGLHRFQVDAFLSFGTGDNAILALPVGTYRDVKERYRSLLRDNVSYLLEMGRNETDPSAFGTAPWRALQLYDLAVKALRAGDLPDSLYYLGLTAHYVGDLAEPLNTTVNGDGLHYPISAAGVQAAFERDGFEKFPLSKGAVVREARDALGGRGLDGLTRERFLGELLRLVNDGSALIDPVLKAFSRQCGQFHGRALASIKPEPKKGGASLPMVPAHDYCEPPVETESAPALLKGFLTATVGRGDDAVSVREASEHRLGDAAALIARLWAAAYNDAGRPAVGTDLIPFAQLKATERYVEPDFLSAPIRTR